MTSANAQPDMQASATGLVGAAAGFGLSLDASSTDATGVSGPFLVGEVVDDVGELVGVVGVVDDGDGADGLLAGLLPVAAGELDGTGRTGSPVGSGAEIAARFSMPVTTTIFTGDGGPQVVFVAMSDRRGPGSSGGSTSAGAPNPGAHPGLAVASGPAGASGSTLGGGGSNGGLQKLINVSLEVSVELGRTRVTLADVLDYDVGSTIELDRAAGAPVDIRVNDSLLAHGEVVLVADQYAVRVTEILDPNQRQ